MAKKISAQYDHLSIPLLGLVAESLASAPGSPVNGRIYYDTALGRYQFRENGAWVNASQTGSELLANKNAAGGYPGLTAGKLAYSTIPIGTGANTVAAGDDTRLTNTRTPTDASVTGGPAGAGVKIAALTITHDNIAAATLTLAKFNASASDQAAGTASLRTLGTSGTSAAAGNDARLSDTRTPTDASVTLAKINSAIIDPAAGTAGLRTLGTTNVQAMPGNYRLDQIATATPATAPVDLNGQRITGLGAPTQTSDAVRKADLDAVTLGIDNKPSARLVSTAQRALTGLAAIDGVTPGAGDRVLLVGQTTPSENGPWIAAAGAWSRATDQITSGSFWMVSEGTTYGGSQWKVNTPDPITVGSTALTINQFAAAGTTYVGTTNRITVTGGTIDIAATYVGQTSITTLGTITTGTWTATAIAIANGGTGATTAPAARTALGASGVATGTMSFPTPGSEVNFVHNLNTTNTVEMFKIVADGTKTDLAVRTVDANTIGVTSDVVYGTNAIAVTVIG